MHSRWTHKEKSRRLYSKQMKIRSPFLINLKRMFIINTARGSNWGPKSLFGNVYWIFISTWKISARKTPACGGCAWVMSMRNVMKTHDFLSTECFSNRSCQKTASHWRTSPENAIQTAERSNFQLSKRCHQNTFASYMLRLALQTITSDSPAASIHESSSLPLFAEMSAGKSSSA